MNTATPFLKVRKTLDTTDTRKWTVVAADAETFLMSLVFLLISLNRSKDNVDQAGLLTLCLTLAFHLKLKNSFKLFR